MIRVAALLTPEALESWLRDRGDDGTARIIPGVAGAGVTPSWSTGRRRWHVEIVIRL